MFNNYGFIYVTTNNVNGKKYIGQCSLQQKNKTESYLGSGKALKAAISKYGRESFSREIIFVAFSAADLNWAEQTLIEEFNATKSAEWYNIAPGGRASLGFTGKKHSKERNEKLSEKMKGHSVSQKVIDNMRKLGQAERSDVQRDVAKRTASSMGKANGIPITINDKTYASIKEAKTALNIKSYYQLQKFIQACQ